MRNLTRPISSVMAPVLGCSGTGAVVGAANITGSNAASCVDPSGTGSSASNNLRQLNTWFAFTPCSRAMRATEASGSKVNATSLRFNSREWRRYVPRGAR